jgi:hypothetical protein
VSATAKEAERIDDAARALAAHLVDATGGVHAVACLAAAVVYAYKATSGVHADRAGLLKHIGEIFDEAEDRRLS